MALHLATDQLALAIQETREQLRAAGDAAHARFTAATHLVEGFRTEATVRQFSFPVDEPPSLGGTDAGPNPIELVLAALGTCQEIVYATFARVLNIPIDGVSVQTSGDLDPRGFFGVADVPAGLQAVQFDVQIASAAAPAEIARLIETVNAHCPVLDTLQRPIPVTGQYTLNGTELSTTA